MENVARLLAWAAIAVVGIVLCTVGTAAALMFVTDHWPRLADTIGIFQGLLGALIAIPVSGVAIYATLRASREQTRAADEQRQQEHVARVATASGEMIQRTMELCAALDRLKESVDRVLLENLQKIDVPNLARCLNATAESCTIIRTRLETVPVPLQAVPLVEVHLVEACAIQLRKMLTFCEDHVSQGRIPPKHGLTAIDQFRPTLKTAQEYFTVVVLAGGDALAEPVKAFAEKELAKKVQDGAITDKTSEKK